MKFDYQNLYAVSENLIDGSFVAKELHTNRFEQTTHVEFVCLFVC